MNPNENTGGEPREHHHPPADAENALHQFRGIDPLLEPEDGEREVEPGSIHDNLSFGVADSSDASLTPSLGGERRSKKAHNPLDPYQTARNQEPIGEPASDPTDEILGSAPIISEGGELADPRLPDSNDWESRPYSKSEFFVEPAVEEGLVATLLHSPRNFPAVAGVWMALLGFLSGFWGVLLAILGLGFSSAGVYTARHGGRRMAVAIAGVLIASTYLIAHAVMRI